MLRLNTEPDPESNSALKFVIERAKQAQVPQKHVIDKAIDKAKGGGGNVRAARAL